MNITENLTRIKEGKDNIIKSLKNKGVEISDNTLINEIPTIIDNAEIGGGGDTPEIPDMPELVQKYEGATVFRIVVLKDECEIGFAPFQRKQNSIKISYIIDWGDGTIEEIDTDSHIYHIYNTKGVYDINCYNFNNIHYIRTNKEIETVKGVQNLNAFDNPKNDSYSFVYNNNKEYDYMCTNILVGSNLEVYKISNNPYLETIYITYKPTSSSLASNYYKYSNNTKLRIFKTDFNLYVDREDFRNCISLETIITPNGVTLTNETALFSGCKELKNISLKFDSYYKQIYTSTFQNCSSLTSINIPNGCTSIGQSAFSGCSSLTSINIPETVTSIANYAFQDCSSLTSINIPETVTSIANYAFSDCSSLQNISIPNSVTSIESYAFYNCKSLQSITCLNPTAPTITTNSFPTSSFEYTKRYLYVPKESTGYNEGNWKTYLIDKGWELRYIEDYEKTPTTLKLKTKNNFFHNLQAIGGVKLIDYELIDNEYIYHFDDKISELIKYTFYNNVLEEIELPEGLERINNYFFIESSSLQSVVIPETVTSIGQSAFSGCSSLTSINIPETVTSIRQSVFSGCSSLQNISIPNSVTSIESYAFYNCKSLQSITCLNPTAPTITTNSFQSVGSNVPSGTPKVLRVPENSTGYNEGYWKTYVIDKGYILEYVPLSEL